MSGALGWLVVICLLSLAAAGTADAQVPTAADIAACNEEAPRAIKAGMTSPTNSDHARADRARGGGMASGESADPQIHGMESEGAKNPTYQAAYRGCMRRKGF